MSLLGDSKYLIAYLAPIAAYLGIYYGGIWSFGAMYIGFVYIPLAELFTPNSTANLSLPQENKKAHNKFFDFLLYLNVPILYTLILYYLYVLSYCGLQTYEIILTTLSVGLVVGTSGINVAHELGHRNTKGEQVLSKMLLLPAMYMHFNIEHNRGHHKHVATDHDPASARFGENIYFFWFRSTIGSYISAWRLENQRLKRKGQSPLNRHNEMIWFQVIQLAYLTLIYFLFGGIAVITTIAIAVVGFLLLESINYIEHYGLRRKKISENRYEPVQPQHSWNSNHEMGRIFLYELTRHSDHHYKATRKYQVLRHFDESPQLPFGYPTAILTALIPPLWFGIMNKRVKVYA